MASVLGPKISAISDEETTSSPHFIDKHDNVSRINDIEYASGGLLSGVDEELPSSAPYRVIFFYIIIIIIVVKPTS